MECPRAASSALTCSDAIDLVALVAAGYPGFRSSWENGGRTRTASERARPTTEAERSEVGVLVGNHAI